MPISTDCLEKYVNTCAAASPNSLKTQQLVGVPTAIEQAAVGCSVATIADLPDASLNEGRFVFVENCGAYRYSDCLRWTNDYSTSKAVNYAFLIGCGYDQYTAPAGQFCGGNEWSQTCTGGNEWGSVGCGGYIRQTAITRTGEIYNWGYRSAQCGSLCSTSPVQECTSSLTDFCYAVDGEYHSMALKSDGSLWAYGGLGYWESWGQNTAKWCAVCCTNNCYDACGWSWLNTTYISVGAGNRHTAVVKSDGTLWTQGLNCMGSGAVPSQGACYRTCSSPVQEITSSSNWSCVVIGCAWTAGGLKTDGTKWGWGTNCCGSLGVNNLTTGHGISSPVQEASSATNWCALQVNCKAQFMIKTDGTLWGAGHSCVWGGGSSSCYYSSPIQELGSATNWCDIGGPLAPYPQFAITTTNELYKPCLNGGWMADSCATGKQICDLGGSRGVTFAIEYTCKGFNTP